MELLGFSLDFFYLTLGLEGPASSNPASSARDLVPSTYFASYVFLTL